MLALLATSWVAPTNRPPWLPQQKSQPPPRLPRQCQWQPWLAGGAALLQPAAALAADASDAAANANTAADAAAAPDDTLLVVAAVALLALTGLLNLSLGDIAEDEAMLPSSVNLINQNRARRSEFIKGTKGDGQ